MDDIAARIICIFMNEVKRSNQVETNARVSCGLVTIIIQFSNNHFQQALDK